MMDKHTAGLLNALGYVCERFDEDWADIGGPESGPQIVGHPAGQAWVRDNGDGTESVLVVFYGELSESGTAQKGPEGWEDQFGELA